MSQTTPSPLPKPEAVTPDATWQEIRDAAVADLRDGSWTDHNPSDPGITMLEAASLSLADLHYRSANTDFDDGPVVSRLWAESAHWSGIDLPADTESLAIIADALSAEVERATIDGHVDAATSRAAAIASVVNDPTLPFDYALGSAVVRLLRAGTVRRAAMDLPGAIDGAFESVDGSPERALALLKYDPGFADLWDDEILDLFQLRQRRQLSARWHELRSQIAEQADVAEVEAILDRYAIPPEQVPVFAAAMEQPSVGPEFFEASDGSSLVWPPTESQIRAVEPVTAADYAEVAAQVPGVRRAWAKAGQLAGTGWDGNPVPARPPGSRPLLGAVTILIESEAEGPTGELELAVLRAFALPGEVAEVDDPYGLYRDDLDRAAPRRVLCDQLGVSTLAFCPIELKAALHVAVGSISNRADTIQAAADRVANLLIDGRPEAELGANGWNPGEPIRMHEVTQRLADDPVILGVTDVSLRRPGGPWYRPTVGEPEEFALDDGCLPRLADNHCVTVTFVLIEDL